MNKLHSNGSWQAVSNSMVMAGLLPRKIREGFYHPCALHIYDSMENFIPLYRQKYQEEGQILILYLHWVENFIHVVKLHYISEHSHFSDKYLGFYRYISWWLINSLSSNTVQILFVENKSLKSTLLEEIDESQLPEIYGGQLPLVPTQDS